MEEGFRGCTVRAAATYIDVQLGPFGLGPRCERGQHQQNTDHQGQQALEAAVMAMRWSHPVLLPLYLQCDSASSMRGLLTVALMFRAGDQRAP